jgi:hypothetical protein
MHLKCLGPHRTDRIADLRLTCSPPLYGWSQRGHSRVEMDRQGAGDDVAVPIAGAGPVGAVGGSPAAAPLSSSAAGLQVEGELAGDDYGSGSEGSRPYDTIAFAWARQHSIANRPPGGLPLDDGKAGSPSAHGALHDADGAAAAVDGKADGANGDGVNGDGGGAGGDARMSAFDVLKSNAMRDRVVQWSLLCLVINACAIGIGVAFLHRTFGPFSFLNVLTLVRKRQHPTRAFAFISSPLSRSSPLLRRV